MKFRCMALVSFVLLAGITASAQTTGSSVATNSSDIAVAPAGDVSGDSAAGSGAVAPPAEPAQKGTAKVAGGGDDANASYPLIASTGGTLGLFTLETGDLLPKKAWSTSAYGDRFTRMPGSVVVTGIGLNCAYGLTSRWNVYADFEPWEHTHIGLPSELSLDSNTAFSQYGSTIYRQLGVPSFGAGAINPGYVEDYPFAANNGGGVGAVTLGVKFGVLSQAKGAPVSLSLRNDFLIPTVRGLDPLLNNGTQTGEFDDQISLAVSHTWGSALTLTSNFGYLFTRDPRADGMVLMQQADQAHVGAGFIAFPGHRVEVMAEYTGLIFVGAATPNNLVGARDPVDSVTGVRLYPFRGMAIDLGYRYMLNLKDAVDRNGFVIKAGFTPWPAAKPVSVNLSPVAACAADRSSVFAGSNDAVNIRTTATDPDGDPVMYSWIATGGRVDGNGADVRWLPAAALPGSYTVTVTVDDGHGGTTTCGVNTQVQQRPNRPPTVSLSGDRDSVFAGERVHYTAMANDPDGDRLNYTWRANGGNVSPANASADLDTTGMVPGNYTVTVRVEDGRGGAADASAGLEVKTPPPPPQASKINGCDFKLANNARIDNICKRVLDDIALRLQNEARATIVIIGYADPKERRADQLASSRADNAAQYLASKGVDRSRIVTRTGAGQAGAGQQNRRVDVIWVPEDATY